MQIAGGRRRKPRSRYRGRGPANEDDPVVTAGAGAGVAPQPANLNDPKWVCQLNDPFDGIVSDVNQNVQSSVGSMLRVL
jgi:hypothetical protein